MKKTIVLLATLLAAASFSAFAQENQKPDAPAKEPPAKETKPEPKAEPQDAPESAQNALYCVFSFQMCFYTSIAKSRLKRLVVHFPQILNKVSLP